MKLSIIIPAKNESHCLAKLLPELRKYHPEFEIIVVDDGSDDDTEQLVKGNGFTLVRHPYSKGNGASIKTGARTSEADILVFMDADGQHNPEDIKKLLDKLDQGFERVVGARSCCATAW